MIVAQGVRTFVNGNKYIGKFFNGVIEGGGIMSFANGSVWSIFSSHMMVVDSVDVDTGTSTQGTGRTATWRGKVCRIVTRLHSL